MAFLPYPTTSIRNPIWKIYLEVKGFIESSKLSLITTTRQTKYGDKSSYGFMQRWCLFQLCAQKLPFGWFLKTCLLEFHRPYVACA